MSFDFGYLVSANPAAGYASQYNASLLGQLKEKIDNLEQEASMDDFERGYQALLEGETKKAIRLWEKEAQSGVVQAHIALGDLYHHRLKNLQKATFHYQKAYESGETKAGALIFAAKLNLGGLDKNQLESATPDILEEPWFKYVKVAFLFKGSSYLELLSNDGLTKELFTDLNAAIQGGVLPAGTLFCRLYVVEHLISIYFKGEIEIDKDAEEYFRELALVCSDNGDTTAVEIYLFWLLFMGEYTEAKNFISSFDSQFQWPEEKDYDVVGLAKAFLFLPLQEKSTSKKLFGATKSLTSAFGSNILDSFSSDWEVFEVFKRQVQLLENQSERINEFFSTLEQFGVVEARRVYALDLVKNAFLDEAMGMFGSDDDGIFLHLYFFLSLSRLCIENWQIASDEKKADIRYTPFIPVLRDFIKAFFGESDDFAKKWNFRELTFDSQSTKNFNERWIPYLSDQFKDLESARKSSNV